MAAGSLLVGRARPLRQVLDALDQRRAAVVVGDAGVGKTHLVRAALTRAASRGATTRFVVATAATSAIPYAAVAELVADSVAGDHVAPLDVLRRTVAAIGSRDDERNLVVAVDDAHHLDEASATLLVHLVRAGVCQVLATVLGGHETAVAVASLSSAGPAARIALRELERAEVDALATNLLGGPADAATCEHLWRLSQGNPLFVSELIASGRETGALIWSDARWRIRGRLSEGQRLQDIIAARLDRLGDDERGVAETVALGEPLGAALLEAICGERSVVDAERLGLLTMRTDRNRAGVVLAHPLYGSVLRSALPPLRARAVYRRLSDALAASGARRREDLLRLAWWQLESGHAPDAGVLIAAARRALLLGDPRLALRLADPAAAGGDPHARLIAAAALQAHGRPRDADAMVLQIDANPRSVVAGRTALLRATGLVSAFGRAGEAFRLIDDALDTVADAQVRDELAALRAMILLNQGQISAAAAAATAILQRGDAPPAARLRALLVAVPAWAHAGRTQQAASAASGALVLLQTLPDAPAMAGELVRLGLCLAHGLGGRYDQAEALANRAHLDALEHVADELRAAWTAALGHLALARGTLRDALELLQEAAELLDAHPSGFGVYSLAWSLGCVAEVAAALGDAAVARAALTRSDAVTPEPCFIGNREIGRIWTTAAEGDIASASDIAREVVDEALARGNVTFAVTALHDAVRLGGASEVADRLTQLAEKVDSTYAPLYVRHARAVAEGAAPALDEVSIEFERIGRLLLAAEAAAEAAEQHRRAGRSGRANAAAVRARRLAQRCDDARTPALRFALSPHPLTSRERQVAALAASGVSSRNIAERLVVSVRTVENHLQRVYDKLGVRQRAELTAALDRLGDGSD